MTSAIAALLSGICGALGIGGGGILIIFLTVFQNTNQLTAQGINLLFFIPCGTVAVIIHAVKKRIDLRAALLCIAGGVFGAVAGIFLSSYLGGTITGRVFAVLLIALGICMLFSKGDHSFKDKK